MARRSSLVLVSATVLATVLAGGCLAGDANDESVRDFVAGVSTADGSVRASFVAGPLPPAGAGPVLDIETNAAVIPGGTTPARLSADRAFTSVVIAIDGIGGYYVLSLPSARTSTELIVTLSQELIMPSFNWIYGIGTAGTVGSYGTAPASVVNVGTGDVQVSLSWNSSADLDLHVVDPTGEEIYWLSRESASGGELDLDSNAGCGSDGLRNENITWPTGQAPSGTYRVLVNYWSNCGVAATDYTVTVNVKGQAPTTFAGRFTGEGNRGGSGSGVLITTFSSGVSARTTAGEPRHYQLGTVAVHHDPAQPTYTK